MNLNPAVGFHEKNGNRRWTRMNADFHEKRLSPVGGPLFFFATPSHLRLSVFICGSDCFFKGCKPVAVRPAEALPCRPIHANYFSLYFAVFALFPQMCGIVVSMTPLCGIGAGAGGPPDPDDPARTHVKSFRIGHIGLN
jgi:hypothetical protein